MGNSQTKTKIHTTEINNNNNVNVFFVQLAQLSDSFTTPEQLNLLLGLGTPKYGTLEGTRFPYLFCVHETTNIEQIAKEYKYDILYKQKYTVLKSQFNPSYVATTTGNDWILIPVV
jgi:hypothetical protein